MLGFLRPYLGQLIAAAIALIATASVTLSVGQGLRLLIDEALAVRTPPDVLMVSIAVFAALVLVLAAGTYARFYFISWVWRTGQRGISGKRSTPTWCACIPVSSTPIDPPRSCRESRRIRTLLQTVLGASASIALAPTG